VLFLFVAFRPPFSRHWTGLAAAALNSYTPGCETLTGMMRAGANPQRLAALALLLFAVGLGIFLLLTRHMPLSTADNQPQFQAQVAQTQPHRAAQIRHPYR